MKIKWIARGWAPVRIAVMSALTVLALGACQNESADSLVASARSYEAKGDHKAAIIQLRNALQDKPENGEARLLLGRLSLQASDPATAEKELRKALEYGQSPDVVLPSLAQAMVDQGAAAKLVEEFGDRKLTDSGANAAFLTVLGQAQLQLGKPAAAKAAFDTAAALDPNLVAAQVGLARLLIGEGKLDDAVQLVDRIIAVHPKAAEPYALQADLRLVRGDIAGARASLEQSIAADGTFLPARYALIQALINERQFDAAEAQLAEARKLRAGDLRATYFDAVIAFGKKDLPKARESAQVVLKSAPDHVPSLVLSGAVELQAGQTAAAEAHLRRAVSLAPQHSGARRMLVRTYLGANQPSKALETIQPLLSAGARLDPQMQMLLGETYLANGDLKQASTFYAAASDSKAQAPYARTRLGQIALASGNPDAGIKELESASGLDGAPMQADMALIVGYVRKNDLDKALEAANNFVRKNPTSPLAQQLLGAVYAARKNMTAARVAYSRAVELDPAYLPAVANLARLDLIDKKPADARKRFEAVVERDPKNEQALLGLAEILIRTGAPADDVSAMLQRAVSANPQSVNARLALIGYLGRTKNPRAALSAAQDAEASLRNDPRILQALAQAQEAAGDVNQAVETFNRVASLDSQSSVPLLRLAALYAKQDDYGKAVEALRRAQKISPNDPAIARDLVRGYLLSGKADDALKEAKSLQTGARAALGYSLEGDVHAATKRWPEAERAYREGLRLDPNSDTTVLRLHATLTATGKTAEADALSRKWLSEHPKDTAFRSYLAEQALRAKNYRAAVPLYQAVIAQQPDNVVALNNLAWAAGQLNDPKALSYAERAAQLSPSAPVLDTLGTLLVAKGDAVKGVEVLAKAVALAPTRNDIRLNYAKALAKAGRAEDARKEFTALQAVSEDFPGKSEIPALLK